MIGCRPWWTRETLLPFFGIVLALWSHILLWLPTHNNSRSHNSIIELYLFKPICCLFRIQRLKSGYMGDGIKIFKFRLLSFPEIET
jgi:hypothetical protein